MDEHEEETLQLMSSLLSAFGKSNRVRFHVLEDLSLAAEGCKTSEATREIQGLLRAHWKTFQTDQASLNRGLSDAVKALQRTRRGAPSKEFDKGLKKLLDQFVAVTAGRGRLRLKIKDPRKAPQIQFEMKL